MDKREIIINNYEKPFHRGLKEKNDYLKIKVNNNECIDELELMVKLEDGIIKDILFDGEACMIVIASTSILIKNLIGLPIEEGLKMLDEYEKMIEQKEYDKELLKELVVFDDIYRQPSRKTCTLLSTIGLKKIIKK